MTQPTLIVDLADISVRLRCNKCGAEFVGTIEQFRYPPDNCPASGCTAPWLARRDDRGLSFRSLIELLAILKTTEQPVTVRFEIPLPPQV